MYYIIIDIGTTGGKIHLFDDKLNLLNTFHRDYRTFFPNGDVTAEHNPLDWWNVATEGIRELVKDIDAGEVGAIGLSCMTPVLLPLNGEGEPLTNAWLWYDRRGEIMMPELESGIKPDRLAKICGSNIKPISFLLKLLYFKKYMPAEYSSTAAFVQADGYIAYRLTGELSLDLSHVSLLHLVDRDSLAFSSEIFEALDLDMGKFPALTGNDKYAGSLSPEAAAELGLKQGIPVISGGHDSALSAYSFGIDCEGKACLDLGNAANLVYGLDHNINCPAADVYLYPENNNWLFQIYCATFGASFRWFRDVFAQDLIQKAALLGRSEYDMLCELAGESEVGSNGLLFFANLQGSQHCSSLTGGWQGLRLLHTRADMVRSVLEGNAFGVRYNRDTMESVSGIKVNEIIACGGGAKNGIWMQMFADILNCNVSVVQIPEAAGTGAALLAYKYITGSAPERAFNPEHTYVPNEAAVEKYETCYQRYKESLENQIAERK